MRRWSWILVLLLGVTGCLEEELVVQLEPDGRGTLRLERVAGPEISEMILGLAGAEGRREEAPARFAAEQLAGFTGIEAWSDVEASVGEDGRLRLSATGWFADLGRVRHTTDNGEAGFTVTPDGEARVISYGDAIEEALRGPAGAMLLDLGPDEEEDLRAQLEMAGEALRGYRQRLTLVLPDPPQAAPGWQAGEGGRLVQERDAAWVRRVFGAVLDGSAEVRAALREGEIARDEAERRLEAHLAGLLGAGVRWVPSAAADEGAAFTARWKAALEGWSGSPWRLRVEEARDALREAFPGGVGPGEDPVPAGLDRTTPDAFEPNDRREQAAALGPGLHENLLLAGEDWYRIEVPAGAEARVEVRFDARRGDIDLELVDAAGAPLASSGGIDNAERLRYAPAEGPATVFLRVHNGANPYHLALEVTDFAPLDAYEPNEVPSQARDLAPGDHEGLVCTEDDYYAIEVPAGKQLEVTITFDPAEADLDLELRGPRGEILALSDGLAGRERVRSAAAAGRTLIHVFGGRGPYRLSAVLDDGPRQDALEDNDAPEAARQVEPGRYPALLCDGQDWYRLQVPPDRRLVTTCRTDGEGELDLTLYDARGEELDGTTAGGGAPGRLAVEARLPRTVLLQVAGDQVGYTLEVALEELAPRARDRFEPNDSRQAARALPPGRHEGLAASGLEDWYRVAVPAGKTLRVRVELRHRDGDLDLELQDALGTTLASSTTSGDVEELEYRAPGACELHLRVYLSENAYTLTVAVE